MSNVPSAVFVQSRCHPQTRFPLEHFNIALVWSIRISDLANCLWLCGLKLHQRKKGKGKRGKCKWTPRIYLGVIFSPIKVWVRWHVKNHGKKWNKYGFDPRCILRAYLPKLFSDLFTRRCTSNQSSLCQLFWVWRTLSMTLSVMLCLANPAIVHLNVLAAQTASIMLGVNSAFGILNSVNMENVRRKTWFTLNLEMTAEYGKLNFLIVSNSEFPWEIVWQKRSGAQERETTFRWTSVWLTKHGDERPPDIH